MENLELQLKQQIIEALNLEEITAEEIATDAPLFGEGLGLDSIDALEITLLLEKHYGIRLANPAEAKPIFHSSPRWPTISVKTANEHSRPGHRDHLGTRQRGRGDAGGPAAGRSGIGKPTLFRSAVDVPVGEVRRDNRRSANCSASRRVRPLRARPCWG